MPGSGDRPTSIGCPGKAEGEESAQVQPGEAVMKPGVVLDHSTETEASIPAGQPGDAAFDQGAFRPLGLLELRGLRAVAMVAS